MKGTFLSLGFILLFAAINSALASGFTHIKLRPEIESALLQNSTTSAQNQAPTSTLVPMKSLKGIVTEKSNLSSSIRTRILSTILGVKSLPQESSSNTSAPIKGDPNWSSPFPTDGEESPIYEQIRRELEASHEQIGLGEVTQLDFVRRQFNMGVDNFSGFSWQKPFGAIQVWADRQVTPNLFGSNWLIADTFTIDIAATTFLETLTDAGMTEMSAVDIGAFAGITFRRVYTIYHYANSYEEGLRADFSKLFLPFLKFYPQAAVNLGSEEIIKKEDIWTIKAGGMVTSPPFYGVSGSVGVLAEGNFKSLLSIQSNPASMAETERLRVSLKQTKGAMAQANLTLQLDFFKLLKLTILSYDLQYEFDSAKEFQLSLPQNKMPELVSSSAEGNEFKKILRGYAKVNVLEPYVSQLNENESSTLAQRGSVLIWGKLSKSKTEQVRVIKDGMVKTFYKNYAQSVKVVQNFLSRILGAVVYKIFKFPMGIKNAAYFSHEVTLEYEATHPQAGKPDVMRIDSTSQASILMNISYEAARTDRWVDRKYKNDIAWVTDSFTTLAKNHVDLIKNEQLKGPMRVTASIRIEKTGLDFMIYAPENNIVGPIVDACNSKRKSSWLNASTRAKMIKKLQVGKDLCVKKILKDYYAFKDDLAKDGRPSLAKLKKVVSKFFKETNNINEIKAMFGTQNVFINGQLQATTAAGAGFTAPFHDGIFRGLGVIDNYKRSLGSRSPASVVNE